jgi:hypothetical protein
MSGRLATTQTNRRARAPVAFVLALLAGTAGLAVGAGVAAAQPPKGPTRPEDLPKVDPKNPVPADAPRRPVPAKFAVPNPDRRMFAEIVDFKPVASEPENPDEYRAWCEVVTHAKQFAAADLEQAAARDLTPLDLIKTRMPAEPNRPRESPFRCELVRFDGKLICARRLEAPLYFKNTPELGVKELYEVRFVPTDESPLTPVSVVFTDLPEFLGAVRAKPAGEWADAAGYVSAAGYYFKTMNVPGEPGSAVVGVPVLIGRSVTALPGPPAPPGAYPTAIDPNVRVFKFIRDKTKTPPRPRPNDTDTPWEEAAAFDRVVRHAARFSAEELEKYARDDLKFADLFLDESGPNYRLQLVKLEGRLIRVKRIDPVPELKSDRVENMFEGWLVPANEPRGNPVCIVFTEPLEGVPPADRVNKWVSCAAYYFKKMRYQSMEQDPKSPDKNLDKYAPLLIGRGMIPRPDPDAPSEFTWGGFVLGAIVGGVLLIAGGGVLTWYYRRGDRKAKEAMDAVRHRNPFDPKAAPAPPVA